MKPEDKNLVLRDLCARLPYNVWVRYKTKYDDIERATILNGNYVREIMEGTSYWIDFKPYLRSMSSMPEEEFEYLAKLGVENSLKCIEIDDPKESFSLATKFCVEQLGYLYEHHYDVNGLIPSGLAIEVTEDNNPYKG